MTMPRIKILRRVCCIALCLVFLLPLIAACSDAPAETAVTAAAEPEADAESDASDESTEPRDTRFDGVNYNGRAFRVSSSIDASDATNANALIAGSGELNGELLNDAVFNRNAKVEELLGITLEFTETSYTFDTASTGINNIVMSGEDAYDIIINDLRTLATLSAKGLFHNVYGAKNFDYEKPYWYKSAMDDLQIVDGCEFVCMSDYFMDIIQSCHAMFYNKDMCADLFGDANLIYNEVTDGTWTYDNMLALTERACVDLDGNSKITVKDQFGFATYSCWGACIPFIGSSSNTFIDRSSGNIEFALDNERSYAFLEKMVDLFYSPGTIKELSAAGQLVSLFANKNCFIVGYQRLGSLSLMRDIDFDIGVIPYPKLYETDDYVTSLHDTIECGVIPVTAADTDFATTCLEVLNRETSGMVMYEYYETALKVKYTTDEMSATMIDIIHDNFGNSFPMAYDNALGTLMMNGTFYTQLNNKNTDFASAYASRKKVAAKLLQKMIDNVTENCSGVAE